MNERGRLPLVLHALVACVALAGIGTATAAAEKRVQFNIAPQDLLTALNQFAQQSNQELLFSTDVAASKRTGGVTGEFPLIEALRTLLEGTGLGYRITSDNTILIERTGREWRVETTSSVFRTPLVLAQATPVPLRAAEDAARNEKSPQAANGEGGEARERDEAHLGDMTVTTGSHLRGVETASPLLVFDQTDFDKAGAATAQQFLATLPQNFGGGQSEDTINKVGLQFNPSFGSAVNLRGQGSGSTLILINGHRAAAAGTAEYVDISMIPLSAVERIEVLTDGASAIYGSDAIGGVVNFIMRKDYDGIDTRLRYGTTTQGGADEQLVGQSAGTRWSSGGAILSYQYHSREALSSLDRDFSRSATGIFDGPRELMPGHRTHSVYLAALQDIHERLNVSASALYTDRHADYAQWDAFGGPSFTGEFNDYGVDTKQYGGLLGITLDLGGSWQIEVAGNVSRNEIDVVIMSPSQFGGLGALPYQSEYKLWSTDAKLTGDLFRLPGGEVKLAVGASYRDETYVFSDLFSSPPAYGQDARAAFAELLVPLIGPAYANSQAKRLILDLAGRYEKYSVFGSTFDPKFGVRWTPSESLSFRATYGTSFKAPNAYQLNDFNTARGVDDIPDQQAPTGLSRSLVRGGNNSDLFEETATTWTVGVEWAPEFLDGLKMELSYFDIDYSDRISEFLVATSTLLNDPIYALAVTRRGEIPDAEFNALATQVIGSRPLPGCDPPDPAGPCTEPVANIQAIVDRRITNIAGSKTSGIDWMVDKRLESRLGSFDVTLNASYLLDYEQQVTESAPSIEFADTATNPVRLRARAGATWNRSGWAVTTSVNYTDDYSNRGSIDFLTGLPLPLDDIGTWTTVDLNVGYDTAKTFTSELLEDVRLSLTVANLFDKDPPSYDDGGIGLGYDLSNADPLGRVISLQVNKSW